jgi:hypothetical protein
MAALSTMLRTVNLCAIHFSADRMDQKGARTS